MRKSAFCRAHAVFLPTVSSKFFTLFRHVSPYRAKRGLLRADADLCKTLSSVFAPPPISRCGTTLGPFLPARHRLYRSVFPPAVWFSCDLSRARTLFRFSSFGLPGFPAGAFRRSSPLTKFRQSLPGAVAFSAIKNRLPFSDRRLRVVIACSDADRLKPEYRENRNVSAFLYRRVILPIRLPPSTPSYCSAVLQKRIAPPPSAPYLRAATRRYTV